MTTYGRLAELLADPAHELDRLASVISGALKATPLEDEVTAGLDLIASDVGVDADADAVIRHVFGTLGFRGNAKKYYAPENSLIDDVIRTKTGNPLCLAVIAIEVGRRCDVHLSPVGMPAHFLIGDGHSPQRWFDPFSGGRELQLADCEQMFNALTGPEAEFSPLMLLPIPNEAVIGRMIANLRNAYVRLGEISRLVTVLQLRTALPDATVGDKVELARMLGALGRDEQAADWYLRLAESEPGLAEQFRVAAARHRARLN